MEDTKFSVEDYKSISTPSNLNIPEVNNKHTEPSILEVCEAEFDSCEGIVDFYEKFRGSVCKNLKKKGYRDGELELLQDEILSPTFEEVILLWCLDKVQPNLSRKIRPEFNDKLGTGVPMVQLKDEIFKFCSQGYNDLCKKNVANSSRTKFSEIATNNHKFHNCLYCSDMA